MSNQLGKQLEAIDKFTMLVEKGIFINLIKLYSYNMPYIILTLNHAFRRNLCH